MNNKENLINIPEILGIEKMNNLEIAANRINIAADRAKEITEQANNHIGVMCFVKDIKQQTKYKSILDSEREQPTCNDVANVINELINRGYNKADIARLIDISPTKNRTIDRWSRGDGYSTIPYAAWRLLCSYAGYSVDLTLPDKGKSITRF